MHDLLAGRTGYPEAVSWYREGMTYCNDHDIATYGSCLLAGQAAVELDLGHWDEAESMSQQVLAKPYLSPANAIPPHKTLGQLLGRRGEPGGHAAPRRDRGVGDRHRRGGLARDHAARARRDPLAARRHRRGRATTSSGRGRSSRR